MDTLIIGLNSFKLLVNNAVACNKCNNLFIYYYHYYYQIYYYYYYSYRRTEYEFSFNDLFEIHDEIGILKKMGFCYGLDSG